MSKALVIPCYNEADRLPVAQVERLLRDTPDLRIYLVDDGSKDATPQILRDLAAANPRITAHILPQNGGKSEAVRAGLRAALEGTYSWVGFADADFATPADELTRLLGLCETLPSEVILGSRVLLLGTDIERKPWRHYLGRVFATFASLALQMPVYDTQCGAKFFKVTPALRTVLSQPFTSRWAFDVEFIGRLKIEIPNIGRYTFVEVPLQTWHDIQGSKLKATSMLKAGLDLIRIALLLRRRRPQTRM